MRSAIAAAERIAQAVIAGSAADAGRHDRLEQLVRQFDDNRHVQAMVVDRQDKVVLASRPASPGTRVPHWFRRLLDRGPTVARITLPLGIEGDGAVLLRTD